NVAHISYDTNDLHQMFVGVHVSKLDPFSDGVAIRPVALGQRLADNCHMLTVCFVRSAEQASAQKWNSHRIEVTSTRNSVLGVTGLIRIVINQKPTVCTSTLQWQNVNATNCAYTS